MSEYAKGNLKLIGKNQEDLKVISAYSQDSIVTVKDMVFLEKNKCINFANKNSMFLAIILNNLIRELK